ncbi:MAG: ATP synthase F1 subunit delta [Lachnospiraceae bacterium]|jgi:F-type H+-transporting ATPase subunit delta|nr:ATP synthase F1 subunit delta [Lachnospiraceae bacterium]
MAVIEGRYAEALLAAAGEPSVAQYFEEGLADLCAAFSQEPRCFHFMTAPTIPNEIKKETLGKIFNYPNNAKDGGHRDLDGEVQKLFINFLSLLIDKNRLRLLPDIYREYHSMKAARQNVLEIKISSAAPLPKKQVEAIADRYKRQYGAAGVTVTSLIDPLLLGGVLIQIGDIRIDDTQKGRLRSLQRAIREKLASS